MLFVINETTVPNCLKGHSQSELNLNESKGERGLSAPSAHFIAFN